MNDNEQLRADFLELVKGFDALVDAASLLQETTAGLFTNRMAHFAAELVVLFATPTGRVTTGPAFEAAVQRHAPAASDAAHGRSYNALYTLLAKDTSRHDMAAFTRVLTAAAVQVFNVAVYNPPVQPAIAQEQTPTSEPAIAQEQRPTSEPAIAQEQTPTSEPAIAQPVLDTTPRSEPAIAQGAGSAGAQDTPSSRISEPAMAQKRPRVTDVPFRSAPPAQRATAAPAASAGVTIVTMCGQADLA